MSKQTEAPSASQDLRAFEDHFLGPDAARGTGGELMERGHGSRLSQLPDEHKALHAALEKAVGAEAKIAKAQQDLAAATVDLDAARKAIATLDERAAEQAGESQVSAEGKAAIEDAARADEPTPKKKGKGT